MADNEPRGKKSASDLTCDVLVIGSGAGGLSTAVTARKHGADVLVVEKEPYFGGTTAFSGGIMWIPGNPWDKQDGKPDTRDAMRTYMRHEAGNHYKEDLVEAFFDNGPRMLEFFSNNTELQFVPYNYPDYHPDAPGGVPNGRSVSAAPYDARRLGPELPRLRPPLRTITFIGMMFNSASQDIKHFFNITRSVKSALYVTKRLAAHMTELARYRRGIGLTSGNALAAALAKSAFNLGIPIWTESPVRRADRGERGREGGDGRDERWTSACLGPPRGRARVRRFPAGCAARGQAVSACEARGRAGDPGAAWQHGGRHPHGRGGRRPVRGRLSERGRLDSRLQVPLPAGETGVFPHLVDRYKPGFIAVNWHGRRFCNEANSYHDVGVAMQRTCEGDRETAVWLLCDHKTIRKYGMGFAKPGPMPLQLYTRTGYLLKGRTLRDLANLAGIDGAGLEETVRQFNVGAERGEDPGSAEAAPPSTAISAIPTTSRTRASLRSSMRRSTP